MQQNITPLQMRKLLVASGQSTRIKGGPGRKPVIEKAESDYDNASYTGRIIEQGLGGQYYPRLDELGVDWYMMKVKFSQLGLQYVKATLTSHTFGWMRDDGFVFIDCLDEQGKVMNTEEFINRLELKISLKNLFKWSKRASRDLAQALKPGTYFSFPEHKARIVIEPRLDSKLYDGAMLINKTWLRTIWREHARCPKDIMLEEFLANFESVASKTAEVTIMTRAGQLKGHAVLTDRDYIEINGELIYFDILAPDDVKTEHGKEGLAYIALKPVVAHDYMYVDIQSLINLHEFLGVERLLRYLKEENERVLMEIKNGTFERILKRAMSNNKVANVDQIRSWLLADFCVRGGHIMWFGSMVKQAARQHLNVLQNPIVHKMRLPIPGGRYYIITSRVMMDAGRLKKPIERGMCLIDQKTGRIIVNDDDWKEWISDVTGGADQDDGYWVVPFKDKQDNKRKVIAWRSPNARGEYAVLKEAVPFFEDYPEMDSSLLPPRIDKIERRYKELPKGKGYQGSSLYSLSAFVNDLERIQQNLGTLGCYINAEAIYIAHTGAAYGQGSYRQEQVIDYTVKEDGDTRPAKEEAKRNLRNYFVVGGNPICRYLADRAKFAMEDKEFKNLKFTRNLWLDRLMQGVEAEIASFQSKVDELAAQACPPIEVFKAGVQYKSEANELLKVYNSRRYGQNRTEKEWDQLREVVEKYLEEHGTEILLGVAAEIYARSVDRANRKASDQILWLLGKRTECGRTLGVGNWFIQELTRIGLLNEITVKNGNLVVHKPKKRARTELVKISQSWFYYLKARGENYESPRDVPHTVQAQAKQSLERIADKLQGMELLFSETTVAGKKRIIAQRQQTENTLGLVAPEWVHRVEHLTGKQTRVKVEYSIVRDGNILAVLAN